jgi:thiamine pyrophosphate-dependent acetolactate synthase large subunit-like protein/nitrite reductase/ring-hydroxylating ferredoxin subunit
MSEIESDPAPTRWHRVLGLDELPEGRVTTVTAGHKGLAITHVDGRYSALDNRCPHQGGPLGEGTIENGYLRCPWHGWDFCAHSGKPPGGFDDGVGTFPVEERDDGIYVQVPDEAPHRRTVSDVMAETMVNWGVTHVFGMVGHSNLGLADAIRRQVVNGNLRYIGIRHEGAAAFAASAYAKLTGRPAACLTIAGPGATNLLTGLWDAKVDRAPVLALTGQVDAQVLGPGAFQEVDLASAFSSVAAWSQTVLPASRHAELMTLAIKHAIQRRDVSHLIFPNEVQEITAKEGAPASGPTGRVASVAIAPPRESLDQAVRMLGEARRPVVIVGHGARFAMDAVRKLAERAGAPVLTTFKGKGLIPDDHPLACGVLGRSGTPVASWFMNESDLLVVFGASFSNHTGITPKLPIIQVDFDQLALGKFHPVACPVWGEIEVTARLMLERLPKKRWTEDRKKALATRWAMWREEKASRVRDDKGNGISPAAVFDALTRAVPDDAVIAVDVGNHAYSFGRYFECRRQSVLMSGYLGSIGFGFPAAMGAWAAAPHRPIVAITGDGGFGQYMGELTTAVKYKMPIRHILLNNGQLGKISKEQKAAHFDVWETGLHNPDFSRYAKLCGALGIRVKKAADLDAALLSAFAHNGPVLVEVMTDPDML